MVDCHEWTRHNSFVNRIDDVNVKPYLAIIINDYFLYLDSDDTLTVDRIWEKFLVKVLRISEHKELTLSLKVSLENRINIILTRSSILDRIDIWFRVNLRRRVHFETQHPFGSRIQVLDVECVPDVFDEIESSTYFSFAIDLCQQKCFHLFLHLIIFVLHDIVERF